MSTKNQPPSRDNPVKIVIFSADEICALEEAFANNLNQCNRAQMEIFGNNARKTIDFEALYLGTLRAGIVLNSELLPLYIVAARAEIRRLKVRGLSGSSIANQKTANLNCLHSPKTHLEALELIIAKLRPSPIMH